MEIKKSPQADLENKRGSFILIGLVMVLSILFIAFEWTQTEVSESMDLGIENVVIEEKTTEALADTCIFINSDKMGTGNDELGEVLIKGYIYTLTECKPYPKSIVFVNSGIKLTTVNEATVENLTILQEAGVEVLSCGTCLDYYGLKDNLKVGNVTNMYTIVELMNNSTKTISI
jgi:selenium metabolism protein YedF